MCRASSFGVCFRGARESMGGEMNHRNTDVASASPSRGAIRRFSRPTPIVGCEKAMKQFRCQILPFRIANARTRSVDARLDTGWAWPSVPRPHQARCVTSCAQPANQPAGLRLNATGYLPGWKPFPLGSPMLVQPVSLPVACFLRAPQASPHGRP